jgi:hypothetical protein
VCAPVNQQLDQVVLPFELVYAAMFFHAQHSRQLLPPFPRAPGMQLQFPPLQLQRFLRSCVLATAHALVTPPATVFLNPTKVPVWIDRIFVRVMSGFVARAEVRWQRARCACTLIFLHALAWFWPSL